MALCTQTDAELYGSVDFSNEPDAAVTLWRNGATAVIEAYCGRTLEQEPGRVEVFTGLNFHEIRLSLTPVSAITSIIEDGVTLAGGIDPAAAVAADDFVIDPDTGFVRRLSSLRPVGWRYAGQINNIVATYDGGYVEGGSPDIPQDLRQACGIAVGDIFRAGQAWAASNGAKRVSIDGIGALDFGTDGSGGVPYFAGNLSPHVKGLLAPFKRYHVGVGGAIA